MNILDKIKAVLGMANVFSGYLPDSPDRAIALFEYDPTPPTQSFGGTDFVYGVQARTRDLTSAGAYALAESVSDKLKRYHDNEITCLQVSTILDIGYDNHNPQRQEYTINFQIRRI